MTTDRQPESKPSLPLRGIRVIDLCDRIGQSTGRLLADLGAELVLVEPDGGMASRRTPPLVEGKSVRFEVRNANKKSVALNLETGIGRSRFLELVSTADLLLDGADPQFLNAIGLDDQAIRSANQSLVILHISDFGRVGPYRNYVATEAVHVAMGALLARSGIDGRSPLLPPGELAIEAASIQAAWVALLALWRQKQTGKADVLDYSINDAVAQILDPGVGVGGSAAAGKTPIEVAVRGRPAVDLRPGQMPSMGLMYPIFRCADGFVRVCTLNPRQWHAMRDWLGPGHPYRDPKYDSPLHRLIAVGDINGRIAALFQGQARAALLEEGERRGIPIAAVAEPAELFEDPHFSDRELFVSVPMGRQSGKMASGYVRIDGRRCGYSTPAPEPGSADIADLLQQGRKSASGAKSPDQDRKPTLQGITVLDLGVIVAGAELGRLFADQGARVIKIESRAFPDGLRQSADGNPTPISFAQGSRGKLSFGLNLRSATGKALFRRLVLRADVVLSNFKPGTLEALGLSHQELMKINPRIVCAESSAMGSWGRRARTMGYGPLVRASSSLTWLWRYPDTEDGFGETVTIFPDHFAARVSAVAVLSKLIAREKKGKGGFVDVSQAEAIMNVLSPEFLRESLEPGSMTAKGNDWEFDAPNSVFQCAGDDEWCVISVTNDEQWRSLCRVLDRSELAQSDTLMTASERLAQRRKLETIVADWCRQRTPYEVMAACQREGVPAGNMLRLQELLHNVHYQSRSVFRELNQPTVGRVIETEGGPVSLHENYSPAEMRPAPLQGQHTRELSRDLLGLTDSQIDELILQGDLEEAGAAALS